MQESWQEPAILLCTVTSAPTSLIQQGIQWPGEVNPVSMEVLQVFRGRRQVADHLLEGDEGLETITPFVTACLCHVASC